MASLFLKAEDSNEEIASYLSIRISMPSVSASHLQGPEIHIYKLRLLQWNFVMEKLLVPWISDSIFHGVLFDRLFCSNDAEVWHKLL